MRKNSLKNDIVWGLVIIFFYLFSLWYLIDSLGLERASSVILFVGMFDILDRKSNE